MQLRALFLLLLATLSACGISQPAIPVARFTQGDLGVVADFARKEATAGPVENQALVLNVLAQCELLQGDIDAAWQHFGAAARVMGNWQTSGSEEFSAIVGSESSKGYTGDPYEKAMNAYYLGMCYLLKGEPDNARAAFKKGILADGESGDEKYQADFTLLFWLAGRMSRAMGLPADAEDFFKEAKKADEFARSHSSRGESNNQLLRSPEVGNLVVLAEVGMGPEKIAAGNEGELARFRPRWSAAHRAQVWIDGELRGPTWMLADVDYQARTRGGTERLRSIVASRPVPARRFHAMRRMLSPGLYSRTPKKSSLPPASDESRLPPMPPAVTRDRSSARSGRTSGWMSTSPGCVNRTIFRSNPKGNAVESSSDARRTGPRRSGRSTASACTRSPGPACITHAEPTSPSAPGSGASRTRRSNAGRKRERFETS